MLSALSQPLAQIVIVTGGNQGLGLETAKALAVAGAHVIIASRTQIKAEQCAALRLPLLPAVAMAGCSGTEQAYAILLSIGAFVTAARLGCFLSL